MINKYEIKFYLFVSIKSSQNTYLLYFSTDRTLHIRIKNKYSSFVSSLFLTYLKE
jgi:hypothetical protein